jgi:hypothetical protein
MPSFNLAPTSWNFHGKFSSCPVSGLGSNVVSLNRQQYYDSEVVDLALLTIFKYIVAGGNVAQHLTVVLRRSPHQDIIHIMSGVVQLWLEYAGSREPSDWALGHIGLSRDSILSSGAMPLPVKKSIETFYDHEKDLFFAKIFRKQTRALPHDDTALFSIIRFLTFAAQQSMTIQWSLLDAGALAVVLIAFVDGVPMLSNLLDAFRLRPNDRQSKPRTILESNHIGTSLCISLSLISTEASKLLDTIQSPAFQALLQTHVFTKRRRICLSLLDVLLGPGGGVNDVYERLRDVFEEILS